MSMLVVALDGCCSGRAEEAFALGDASSLGADERWDSAWYAPSVRGLLLGSFGQQSVYALPYDDELLAAA
jgi:hypothetical protein